MVFRVWWCLLAGLALGCAHQRTEAPPPHDATPSRGVSAASPPDGGQEDGCYRADRPLRSSGVDTARVIDPGRIRGARLYLRRDGTVTRRDLAGQWRRSSWRLQGDSLHVRLSTGLLGWDLLLTRNTSGSNDFSGTARYLTDVVSKGWVPPVMTVSLFREICDAPA